MTDNMKKKEFLKGIFNKLCTVPETKLDYAAGVVDGMSIAYNSIFGTKEQKTTPGSVA